MITGDPIILEDASGLQAYGLKEGDKGIANSLITIPGSDELVYFMKNGTRESIVISKARCRVDEEAKKNTIDIDAIVEGM